MQRPFLILAAILGLTAVAAGTFAAHVIEGKVDTRLLDAFEIGVRYHMYHALALLGVALVSARLHGRAIRAAGWLMTAGVVLFSGSLYLYAVTGVRWLAMITPIGGVCFIAAWVALLLAACATRDAAR